MAMPVMPFKRVDLTGAQKRKWEDTLAAASWQAPGLVHVLYTMLTNSSDKQVAFFTKDMPFTAGTDGYRIIINPDRFFTYELMERVFAVLHEVLHNIFDHCGAAYKFRKAGKITLAGKVLPYNQMWGNVVQDLIINDMMIKSKFGKFNKDWLHDPSKANADDDWVTAYFRTYQQAQANKPKPGDESGNPVDGGKPEPGDRRFDWHMEPGTIENARPEDAPARPEEQWKLVTKAAMEIQRAQGRLSSSMEKQFSKLLKPVVAWEDHIRGELLRELGDDCYDWRKLNRRLVVRKIGAPGRTGYGASLVVVGADSSGSIYSDPTLINRFFGEVSGILSEVNPERIIVVWCDASIKRIDYIEDTDDLKKVYYKGALGGGGTSFVPVFDWIAKEGLQPDALVYLTDGDGTFPAHAPDYPVIWGDVTNRPDKYAWGTHIYVPKNT